MFDPTAKISHTVTVVFKRHLPLTDLACQFPEGRVAQTNRLSLVCWNPQMNRCPRQACLSGILSRDDMLPPPRVMQQHRSDLQTSALAVIQKQKTRPARSVRTPGRRPA